MTVSLFDGYGTLHAQVVNFEERVFDGRDMYVGDPFPSDCDLHAIRSVRSRYLGPFFEEESSSRAPVWQPVDSSLYRQ